MPFSKNVWNFVRGHEKGSFVAISSFSRARLLAEESCASMRNVWFAAWLAAFLVPLFLILDFLVYPEYFSLFLYLRVACVVSILAFLYCSKQRWARRFYRLFAVLLPCIIALYMAIMMYLVRDPGTPYYAGLILCLVGVGALLNWTPREALFTSFFIILLYLSSCVPHFTEGIDAETIGHFANNLLFTIATGLIVVSGSYMHHEGTVGDFFARMHLRKNRAELEKTNRDLGDTLAALQETESQLIQSDKMSFLGQMSAGVIHEIGNPLNFSNQALFILRKKAMKAGSDDGSSEVIDDLQEGLDRIKDIVSEMREFSHGGTGYGSAFRIAEPVDSALRMLGHQIEESNTSVEIDIDQDLEVNGVKNQITQVMVNLVHNAVQAMVAEGDGPGTIKIVGAASSSDGIYLSVTDSGPGIPAEHASRLFDPFFTTKDPGEGTGLGLSICYRIIEAHGGTIRAAAASRKGTVFTITLPAGFSSVVEK